MVIQLLALYPSTVPRVRQVVDENTVTVVKVVEARGRGGRGSPGPTTIPPPASEAPTQEHVHKQVLPEWREHQFAAAQ